MTWPLPGVEPLDAKHPAAGWGGRLSNTDRVLFALPEYSSSAHQTVYVAVRQLARARSPLLSQIRTEEAESIPVSLITDETGEELELSPTLVQVELSVDIDPVADGNLGPLLLALDVAAQQHEEALSKALFSGIGHITDMTGNKIDAGGKPISWDLIIDGLETMEIPFDDQGKMELTLVMNPRDAQRLEELGPPTPEQQARREAVLERKRQEWIARKRTRRLR